MALGIHTEKEEDKKTGQAGIPPRSNVRTGTSTAGSTEEREERRRKGREKEGKKHQRIQRKQFPKATGRGSV